MAAWLVVLRALPSQEAEAGVAMTDRPSIETTVTTAATDSRRADVRKPDLRKADVRTTAREWFMAPPCDADDVPAGVPERARPCQASLAAPLRDGKGAFPANPPRVEPRAA